MSEIVSVFGINPGLLLVQAVNFSIVLLILWRYLYRPLARIISERQKLIETGVENARLAEEVKNKTEAERGAILVDATAEGDGIVRTASLHAKEKEEEIISNARAQEEVILRDAANKAEEIKRNARDESKADVARLAVLAAEKIMREHAL